MGPSPRISHVSSPSTQPRSSASRSRRRIPIHFAAGRFFVLAGLGRARLPMARRAISISASNAYAVAGSRLPSAAGLLEQLVQDRFVRGLELGLRLDRPAEKRLPRALRILVLRQPSFRVDPLVPIVGLALRLRAQALLPHIRQRLLARARPTAVPRPRARPTPRPRSRAPSPATTRPRRIAAAVSASFCTRLEVCSSCCASDSDDTGQLREMLSRGARIGALPTYPSPRPAAPTTSSPPNRTA